MKRVKELPNGKDVIFKRLYGVKPKSFDSMVSILQKEFNRLHKPGGRPPRLTIAEKLTVTLKYLREYRTMESIGADYGISKSTVCETIQWVEDTLAKDKSFMLPGKKILKKAAGSIEYIVVDVTESPIQRPKKTKESGIAAKRNATQ